MIDLLGDRPIFVGVVRAPGPKQPMRRVAKTQRREAPLRQNKNLPGLSFFIPCLGTAVTSMHAQKR